MKNFEFKKYDDCNDGMSILCHRPDCKRCYIFTRNVQNDWHEKMIAAIKYLSNNNKDKNPKIQAIINHFDPRLNGASQINTDRIEKLIKFFEEK